ncbi:L-idonate 5-dehydrogenase [Jannaschia sp. W003]|uniref:L-idonate 5-dehydrogenase n=1 Tax=Jannaschia sp. W003 TaxID=2867012 RepID=UPI0021A71759|nr:L-idonate 5-dehydrogenase [Jannaschia sp. W003]UWQ21866.1 L-idonate 5-dehydrogenase [Jannaschia sp. W003]
MKAVVAHAARDLRIEERPDPGPPGPGEVRVRVATGGICGSDLHYFDHGGFGQVRLREPMILGHEVAGHIEAVGEGVSIPRGMLVAVSPSRPCRDCPECLRGLPNHCAAMRFYGSAMPFPHVQGAFREVLLADEAQCAVATSLSPAEAAMAEPLAVALHAVRRAGDLVGRAVLVTGCGPIGVLAILAARRAGAGLVVATDLSEFCLDMARHAGADVALEAGDPKLAEYRAGKGTFDAAFECSGSASALGAAVAALRPRGVLVQLGLGGDMHVPMQSITAKEIDLRGSFRFGEEFAAGVGLMRRGLIDVAPLVTRSFAAADAVAAFETAGDRTRSMKTQITFG